MLPVPRLDYPCYLGGFRCNFMQFVFGEFNHTLILSMHSVVEISFEDISYLVTLEFNVVYDLNFLFMQ